MSKKQDPAEVYTDPELREKLKEEIKAGEKGGHAGQWSARKSQLLAHEYESHGGGYKSEKRTDAQKSLHEWTEEEWQTADGKIAIRGDTTERYLPREAWERLSDKEKREANAKKEEGSHDEEQYVEWTPAIKRVMQQIHDEKKGQ